jgi:DNA-binding XRE family transcriptional regulator
VTPLRTFRHSLGLTAEGMAATLGVSDRTITNWEAKGCPGPVQCLIDLAAENKLARDWLTERGKRVVRVAKKMEGA